MAIPTAFGGSGTFSLDHLFVDSEAVPVIVEVKRSSDTRIRREVAAQMLDYAANATLYWPVNDLRTSLGEHVAEAAGRPMAEAGELGDQAVAELIGPDKDVDDFWAQVETNLRQGRVRMLFVADQIPDTLRRIIEFLNEQMDPAEVLGVEVVQYLSGDGLQALVPRLIGATTAARETKRGRLGGQLWNQESFLEMAAQRSNPDVVEFFTRLLEFTEASGGRLSWGKGVGPGLSGWLPVEGNTKPVWLGSLGYANPAHPTLTFYFKDLYPIAKDKVAAMVDRLRAIESYRGALDIAAAVDFTGNGSFPNIRLEDIAVDPRLVETVFEALREVVD